MYAGFLLAPCVINSDVNIKHDVCVKAESRYKELSTIKIKTYANDKAMVTIIVVY